MYCGKHWRFDQSGKGQGDEIVTVVYQVKVRCPFHQFGDVQYLDDLGVKVGMFFVTLFDYSMKPGFCYGICGCK